MQNTDNSFAERLNRLFAEKRKRDGKPYTKKEVLEGAPGLTRVYLWRLQSNKVARPGYEAVQALANFFGVQPNYFFTGEETPAQPAPGCRAEDLASVLRDAGLDAEEQKAVILMVEAIKKSKH